MDNMDKEEGNEATGIIGCMLIFASGSLFVTVVNGITLFLTDKPGIQWLVFFISLFLAFIVWPLERAIASDLKDLQQPADKKG